MDNEPKNKKQLVQWWKDEVKAAVRYRTIYGRAKDWSNYKNMYRGLWQPGVVPVNMIYAVGRSLIPQVYFRNPKVAISAKKPGYTAHAMILERIDEYIIKEMGIKNQLKSGVLDCYLMGRGPGILGYDSEFGFNPSFTADSEFADSGLTAFGKKGEKIEYTDEVKPGMPWFLRCSPEDFIVPWGTRRFEEARWFGFRKMRTLRDIKESPLYSGKADLKGAFHTKLDGSLDGTSQSKTQHSEKDGENDWVELWELHDKRTGQVMALSLDHDKFLRFEDDEMQIEGLPSRVLGFNEDTDYFWWTPDARLIKVQQSEMNDIRTMAKKHRRVGLLKGLYDKNMLKHDEMAKFLDGDPKAFAAVDVGPSGDIRKSVAYIQSHIPPDLIAYAREVREDVREIVGFSRNQMGSFEESSGRRTAHEAEIVRAASLIRIDERRDIMADHFESVMRGINQIIFKNWSAERIVDLIGQDGARYWVRFNGEEIKGEFNYGVNPEEALPQNQATRREDAQQFMQTAMQVPGIDMKYLLRQYSRQFEWLDPRMLMPDEGAGRSPEKALMFSDFIGKVGQGMQGGFGG
jgi:hypothetical protein